MANTAKEWKVLTKGKIYKKGKFHNEEWDEVKSLCFTFDINKEGHIGKSWCCVIFYLFYFPIKCEKQSVIKLTWLKYENGTVVLVVLFIS